VVGLSIATFAIGIWAYTINAIGQDEFEDVKVPDVPVKPASQSAKK
jgi:cytochrome c oxidase assembly factor 3